LTVMGRIFRKPIAIAVIVAVLSISILLLVNHTRLIVDLHPRQTPPGTTFNAAKDADASVAPTIPEPALKPTPPGPTPVNPAAPTK
jgi:hypothetical protein